MKETAYDKYKLKRLANGQNYLSEEEFYHLLDTDMDFVEEMISMSVIPRNYLDIRVVGTQPELLKDVSETKEGETMGLLIEPIRCEECNEVKEETEFANRRGGKKSKICTTCMGKRISDGHAKNHSTKPEEVREKMDNLPIFRAKNSATSKPIPLLKERPTIKAISEETLYNIIMMAYKRGYDQGVKAIEIMSDDDALALVEQSCGGFYE